MNNNFIDPELSGSGIIWEGIIVPDHTHRENQESKLWNEEEDLAGWGSRYKIRIIGKNTQDKNKLPDEVLPTCEVLYPVTAGSGHAASYQTSNLRQGSVVYGFWKDGVNGKEPVILGCVGNSDQTYLNRFQKEGFDSYTGFVNEVYGQEFPVPLYSIKNRYNFPDNFDWSPVDESNTSSTVNKRTISGDREVDENNSSLSSPATCDKAQLGAVQLAIRNLIKDIERVQKQANDWSQVVNNGIQEREQFIRNAVDNATRFVSGGIKWIITEIQKRTTNLINDTAKDLYYTLFPNERPELKRKMEKANDSIACLFRKIISNLLKIVTKFLLDAVDRFINTPLCAVENFVGAVLGKLTGLITSGLNAILAPVKALLGIFNIADSIFGFLIDILTFLSCDEEGECPDVKEWNIWDGPSNVPKFDLNSLVDSAKSFASGITDAINPDNFDFDLDFSDVFQDSCNVGAIFCGPPKVQFFGGGGSGATGNAIIGLTGEILGVDITTPGSGYSSAPFVEFADPCGKGKSAVGRALMNGESLADVLIEDPGTDYLYSPDGSLGGDGRTWAENNETTVKRNNGIYDRPYVPGETIDVSPGDSVRFPPNSTGDIDGTPVAGGDYVEVDTETTITSPTPSPTEDPIGDYPTLDDGKYPVVVEIKDIVVDNGGFNYTEDDEIIIEPSNGAAAVPVIGVFGSIEKVQVISKGEGFKQFPRIYIKSQTGYNANLIPLLTAQRISNDQIKNPEIQDSIISVVDCVGKVPDTTFFRVPQ